MYIIFVCIYCAYCECICVRICVLNDIQVLFYMSLQSFYILLGWAVLTENALFFEVSAACCALCVVLCAVRCAWALCVMLCVALCAALLHKFQWCPMKCVVFLTREMCNYLCYCEL